MFRTRFALALISLTLVACYDDGSSALKEKAGIEGEAAAQKQLQAENENLARRAKEMEADLAKRHRFYQAAKGTYEGVLKTEQGQFNIRLTLIPSLPPYVTDRVRALDEIVTDLTNLHFNVQVVQWNPANSQSAVGCRIEKVSPDMANGEITATSESCSNLYMLQLSEDPNLGFSPGGRSMSLAAAVLEGKLGTVSHMVGRVQPTTNASVYEFSASRVTR